MPVVVARKLAFSAVVVLPIMATALAQEPRDVPTFFSGTELVTVDAVVLDDHGRPVRGLTSQDFALPEDGKPQAIVSFEPFDRILERAVMLVRHILGDPRSRRIVGGRAAH